jgi:hypothetical protein
VIPVDKLINNRILDDDFKGRDPEECKGLELVDSRELDHEDYKDFDLEVL